MQFVRMYTGPDGESRFEELDVGLSHSQESHRSEMKSAKGIQFSYQPPGFQIDMHPAPRRQYVITLQGETEIILGDGTSRIFGPGDVLLAEDLTGKGHITRTVGNAARICAQIPLDE